MAVVNYSFARQNLAKLMDEVEQDCAPIFITRQRKRGGAVLVSQAEWDRAPPEPRYLVRNPKDAPGPFRGRLSPIGGCRQGHTDHPPLETAQSARRGATRSRGRGVKIIWASQA